MALWVHKDTEAPRSLNVAKYSSSSSKPQTEAGQRMQCKNRGPRFLPDVSPNVSRIRRSEWSWQQSCLVRHKEATTTTTGSPATEAATSDPEAERQRLSAERLDLGGGGAWQG